MENITTERIARFLIGIAITAIVIYLVWFFSSVVIYILVSAVLAVMFRPLVGVLTKFKFRGVILSRSIAAVVSLFAIWVLFALIFAILVPLVFTKLNELANLNFSVALRSIEEPLLRAQHYIQGMMAIPESDFSLSDSLVKTIKNFVDFDNINSAVSSVVNIIVSFVISFFSISFITFFFLKDDGLFNKMVAALFPDKYAENVERALSSVSYLLSRYFVGILGESLIVATLMSIITVCFGMKGSDALFIGLIMGVLNVIPYAGPFMGTIISLCLGVISPIADMGVGMTALVILGAVSFTTGIDNFILQPTIYSSRVKAHPLEIFIVILLSGYVAGIVGMLLAIPSYTVIRVFAKEFFSQFTLVRRLTDKI
ncbi:MAG: AI-2E family transporter [Rikenellaceae bacterium]